MYADTKRLRNHRVTINLDEYEAAVINALVNYTGTPPSTLLRQMLFAQAEETLLPTHQMMNGSGTETKAQICSK